MSNKDNGGGAYPAMLTFGSGHETQTGMSLRDYFAAAAMQGWLASYGTGDSHPVHAGAAHIAAEQAYKMADAMLAERAK